MRPLDKHLHWALNYHIGEIGKQLGGMDVMSIVSPIVPGIDEKVRGAIESKKEKKPQIAIILETPGGVVEVVERAVEVIRHFYQEVAVIVPNQAMSAGTVFALSADRILMDYFSRLGPIDPQIVKDDRLIPALAYLKKFEELNEKAAAGNLTTAEYVLLQQLNVAELYQFEQARELSVELLIKWLSKYKFKDWKFTETTNTSVTVKMKKKRAKEIATLLNDPNRWHSHGRGIDISTLRRELKLRIEDYSENKELSMPVREYFSLLQDYLNREKLVSFVHTEEYF